MFEVFIQGLLLSAGLIIAIGAQNAYVLKQGALNNHVFWVATVCFLCDFFLMSFAILGIGGFIAKNALFQNILAGCGMLYILYFAIQSFRASFDTARLLIQGDVRRLTRKQAVMGALAITLLNPHVYLDTVVIIGGIAATLEDQHKIAFLLGTLAASLIWFYSLAFFVRQLAPILRKPTTWRILNFLIGIMMLYIAFELALFIWHSVQAMDI